jgi:hypothetical protein
MEDSLRKKKKKKKFSETPILIKKLGRMGHAYNPGYTGDRGRRMVVQGQSWAKTLRCYLKNN